MVDFAKLLNESPEEREERRSNAALVRLQNSLAELADKSVVRRKFTLTEDPEIRYDRSSSPYAIMRVGQGEDFRAAIIRPVLDEDDKDFFRRIERISKGDQVIVDGDLAKRSWRDQKGDWHSVQELEVGIPVSPQALKPELPEGIELPASAYQKSMNNSHLQMRSALENGI